MKARPTRSVVSLFGTNASLGTLRYWHPFLGGTSLFVDGGVGPFCIIDMHMGVSEFREDFCFKGRLIGLPLNLVDEHEDAFPSFARP